MDIRLDIKGRKTQHGGVVKISMRLPESTMDMLSNNELPMILNALARSTYADPAMENANGFPYIFPIVF